MSSLFVFVNASASVPADESAKTDVIQLAQADDGKKSKKGKKKSGGGDDEEPECD